LDDINLFYNVIFVDGGDDENDKRLHTQLQFHKLVEQ